MIVTLRYAVVEGGWVESRSRSDLQGTNNLPATATVGRPSTKEITDR